MLIIFAPLVGFFLVWLMFRLATYALPFGVGVWSGFWLLHHDNGYLISIVGGLAAAGIVLGVGQVLFETVRTPAIRLVLVAVFALPAGIAGYNMAYNLARLAAEPGLGLTILSVVAGVSVAFVASTRIASGPASDGVRPIDARDTA